MPNHSTNRGHRSAGAFTHAAHADAWAALSREILDHLEQHPAPRVRTGNASHQPGSLKALAEAMSLTNSRSTLRHMLRGTTRPDAQGARIPAPDKIKAARAWLKKARKAVATSNKKGGAG